MPDLAEWLIIAPAVAWSALWIQFAVLNFFSKPERLYKDYVASGELALAHSSIETAKITPVRRQIFDKAEKQNQANETPIAMEEVLQSVDYADDLERIENFYGEKRELQHLFGKQKRQSRIIWKVSLCHALSTALAPAANLYLGVGFTFYTVVITAVLSLACSTAYLLRFEATSEQFRIILETNRGQK